MMEVEEGSTRVAPGKAPRLVVLHKLAADLDQVARVGAVSAVMKDVTTVTGLFVSMANVSPGP